MSTQSANWDHCLDHAALSDVGLRRTNNQDSFAVMLASTPEVWQRRGHLFMVADGMGAHAAGEYASKLATDHVPHTYHKEPDASPATAIRKAIEETNHTIHARGQANLEFQGMGTTCSTLILAPEGALVAHVGDSRVYRLRGNRLEQLSFDHSLVWELAANGQLAGEDFANYNIPKNIITRSLGPNPDVKVDLEGPFPVAVGDTFLLCSDGLTGQVKNEELAAILGSLTPQEAVRALVDLANLRGGPDNITVIVVRVTGNEIARSNGAAASVTTSSTAGLRGVHPLFWMALAVLALATVGLFAARLPLFGLAAALATVLTAVAGSILFSRKTPEADRGGGERYGRAPYATAIFAANASFIAELKKVLEQLCDAARQEDWVVDWSRVHNSTAKAEEASDRHDYVAAVHDYCRAISVLMMELRNQRRGR